MRQTRTDVIQRFAGAVGAQRALPLGLSLAYLLTVVLAAQSPTLPARDSSRAAQTTARVTGSVVASDTGQPLARAQVVLGVTSAVSFGPLRTLTDDQGRYEFAGLPAGTFTISASRTGYVNLQYGQRRPYQPGKTVTVAAGATVERIDMSLPRGAVIVARVTDDLGFPVSNVEVRAQRFEYRPDGQRALVAIYGPGPSQTDDRGEIRLFGLMPGEYVVSAVYRVVSVQTGTAAPSTDGYVATFYPGVISPLQASTVSVRIGEETAINFPLVRSRLVRVSGVVVDPLGRPANGARISLGAATAGVYVSTATAGPDGRFVIAEVPPGDYWVAASFDAFEAAGDMLTVAGTDVSDLRITVGPGTSLSGRLVFEGGTPPSATLPSFRVLLAYVNQFTSPGARPGQRVAAADTDARFGFAGLSGRLIVDLTAPDGWMMKSVVVGGKDITHSVFDLGDRDAVTNVVITATNRVTSITGQVTDARGQAAGDYVVVLVPAEGYDAPVVRRRIKVLRPSTEGTFTAQALMPGRYLAVAVEALEEGRQYAPEFQQQIRRLGQEFTLREGERSTLNLRIIPDL